MFMKSKKLNTLFTLFLFFYFAFLLSHAVHEISLWMFLGLGVAILSHAKKNSITLILLLSHVAIEWFEWGLQDLILSVIILNIIHAVMDFVFLNHEIKIHTKLNSYLVLLSVFIFLIFIFYSAPGIKIDENLLEILHRFVLGGVVGCVGTHLIYHLKKEIKLKKIF